MILTDVECMLGLRYGGIDMEICDLSERINGFCNSMFTQMKDILLKYLKEKFDEIKEYS